MAKKGKMEKGTNITNEIIAIIMERCLMVITILPDFLSTFTPSGGLSNSEG
jgi:hypothetical protein